MGTVRDIWSDREVYSFVHFSVLLLVHFFHPSGYILRNAKHTVWKDNFKFSSMNRVKSPYFEEQ